MGNERPKDLEALLAELQRGELRPVYLLVTSEPLLRDEAIEALRTQTLAGSPPAFNADRFDAQETPLDAVLQQARMLPMLGARRWVLVNAAERFLTKTRTDAPEGAEAAPAKVPGGKSRRRGQNRSEDDREALAQYLADPCPSTTLALVAAKADQTFGVVKRLTQAGGHVVLAVPDRRRLPEWLRVRAERLGRRLAPDAAALLVDAVGAELTMLAVNLDKVMLYAGERRTIGVDDVEQCVARTRVHSVFELTQAVGERRLGVALTVLHRAIEAGEQPLMILSMLHRHVRQLWLVRALGDTHPGDEALAAEVGAPPFAVARLRQQAQLFADADLLAAIDRLMATDRALKSTRARPERVMEALVVDLCGVATRPADEGHAPIRR